MTIEEKLNELPKSNREMAIMESKKRGSSLKLCGPKARLSDTLAMAFLWSDTPQGNSYWCNLYEKLKAKGN